MRMREVQDRLAAWRQSLDEREHSVALGPEEALQIVEDEQRARAA
jgi:hypothetical protein